MMAPTPLLATAVSALTLLSFVSAGIRDYYDSYGTDQVGACYPPPGSIIDPYPLTENNFPYVEPGSSQDVYTALLAHGTRSNEAVPDSIAQDTITSLQFIAFSGLYEVAFFRTLVEKITYGAPGYTFPTPDELAYALETLSAIEAQEEQHVLNANQLLMTFGVDPIQPCKYYYPADVIDYSSAISFAIVLTGLINGALQQVTTNMGYYGDYKFITSTSSVIANEAEQIGWFRSEKDLVAAETAFTTACTREYSFSYFVQNSVVPNSCPNSDDINLQVFAALIATKPPAPCGDTDELVEFVLQTSDISSVSGCSVVWVNQQNKPIPVPIMNAKVEGDCLFFYAYYPCSLTTFDSGLVIGVLANKTADYMYDNAADLEAFTVAGPFATVNN